MNEYVCMHKLKIGEVLSKTQKDYDKINHGFQGGGGGGFCGPNGGIASKIVFMSTPLVVPAIFVKEIKAATSPALPAKVGSV
jgi:hypothetical protein